MYNLVFDEVILKQLKRAGKNKQAKDILSKMLDRIEEKGPRAGDLIDARLKIFEMKSKRPPLRLYFKHNTRTDEMYIFEFEMKTSQKKQQRTIEKLRRKSLET